MDLARPGIIGPITIEDAANPTSRSPPDGTRRPDNTHERRVGLAIFVLCLTAYGYFVWRGPIHNADSRLALTYSLVETGNLSIDRYSASTADRAYRNGHFYTDKAPGVSFMLAPIYAVLRLLPLPDAGEPEIGERFVTRYLLTFFGIGVPAALFASWLFSWLRPFAASIGPRSAVVIGYSLGSPVWLYSTNAFGHVPAGMCLFGAFAVLAGVQAHLHRSRHLGAGALLGLAVACEYTVSIPATIVGCFFLLRDGAYGKLRRLGDLAAGALPALALLAAYHTVAFGAPWWTGYANLDPQSPFAHAQQRGILGVGVPDLGIAISLLAGEHRGLIVVAPWLLLAIPGAVFMWRRGPARWHAASACAVFLSLLLVNGGYTVWDGGAAWGPRHLTPALAFLALLVAPAAQRWPRLACAMVSISVALSTVGAASGALPPVEARGTVQDYVLPAMFRGQVTNNWGMLLGLSAWRSLVPFAVIAMCCLAFACGLRRSYGWLAAGGLALVAATRIDRS